MILPFFSLGYQCIGCDKKLMPTYVKKPGILVY
jgi:hypothetical protein